MNKIDSTVPTAPMMIAARFLLPNISERLIICHNNVNWDINTDAVLRQQGCNMPQPNWRDEQEVTRSGIAYRSTIIPWLEQSRLRSVC